MQLTGLAVVDDEVIRILLTRAHQQEVGVLEADGGRELAEVTVLQLDFVAAACKIGDGVDVGDAVQECVEAEDIAAAATAEGVVTPLAVERVGRIVACDHVVQRIASEVSGGWGQ